MKMSDTMTKLETGLNILASAFFNQKRYAIADVLTIAKARGVSRRTMTRACRLFGVTEVHNGHFPAFWEKL